MNFRGLQKWARGPAKVGARGLQKWARFLSLMVYLEWFILKKSYLQRW